MSILIRPPRDRRAILHRQFRRLRRPDRKRLWDGEPENSRRRPLAFLAILAELGLLLAVFDAYRLETRAFRMLALFSVTALPLHYLTPFRWKKPVFVGLSIVGLTMVQGPVTTMAVVTAGLGLILVAVSPLRWSIRVGVIATAAAWMALHRPDGDTGPEAVSSGFVPVLASIFMFRMIVFLYEQKHAKGPEPLADVLGYFFLMPNAAFTHFPVVDFRTYQRGYFSADIHEIQRTGVAMIARGMLHLLAYRAIDRLLMISPEAVVDPMSLAQYVGCNYLLYLRVSGQFHMACGLLHLYGFRLPETHHHYLLASSFTDYWRRINIYWKDFMVRVVFNPVVFRLKRWPRPLALAAATTSVFLATWLLHAYQSFWLRGAWGFSGPDTLFWGILGGLVLVNVQIDARSSGGGRIDRRASRGIFQGIWHAVRVVVTLTTIAVLWSLWSSPSVSGWWAMYRRGLGY